MRETETDRWTEKPIYTYIIYIYIYIYICNTIEREGIIVRLR